MSSHPSTLSETREKHPRMLTGLIPESSLTRRGQKPAPIAGTRKKHWKRTGNAFTNLRAEGAVSAISTVHFLSRKDFEFA